MLEALHRCRYLESLTITGMDDHATTSDYNDFRHSEDCREHYLHVLEDSIYRYSTYCTSNCPSDGVCE